MVLNKTFVWGHRGAGFTGVQNTIESFQYSVDMGVDGIKTEAKLTKDKYIVLTFQQNLKINGDSTPINQLDLDTIKQYKLENDHLIPTLSELFSTFKNLDIRYNFDINNPDEGVRIIEIAREFGLTGRIEISKPSIYPNSLETIFGKIRRMDKDVVLINSVFLKHSDIKEEHLELETMRNLKISGINVNFNYANLDLFKVIKEKGFKFYVWGVFFRRTMEKFLKMKYNGSYVDAIYSNLPKRLLDIRNEIQGSIEA